MAITMNSICLASHVCCVPSAHEITRRMLLERFWRLTLFLVLVSGGMRGVLTFLRRRAFLFLRWVNITASENRLPRQSLRAVASASGSCCVATAWLVFGVLCAGACMGGSATLRGLSLLCFIFRC